MLHQKGAATVVAHLLKPAKMEESSFKSLSTLSSAANEQTCAEQLCIESSFGALQTET